MKLNPRSVQSFALFAVFFCFFLALANNQIISSFFEIGRWVALACYMLIGFLLQGNRLEKPAALPMISYSCLVLILIVSTFNKVGVTQEALSSLAPFVLIPFLVMTPYPSEERCRATYFYNIFGLSAGAFIITNIPLLLGSDAYIMGRFAGWTSNTNIVAGITVAAFSFYLQKFFSDYGRWYFIAASIALVMLLLTQSRAALLAAVIMSVLLVFMNIRKKYMFRKLAPILIVLALVTINMGVQEIGSTDFDDRSLEVRSFELGARELIMLRQIEAFEYSPLIGVGAVSRKEDSTYRYAAEMSYTDWLSMVGLLGMAFFIVMLVAPLMEMFKYPITIQVIPLLVLSGSEGYLTGIGSAVSILLYVNLLSAKKK